MILKTMSSEEVIEDTKDFILKPYGFILFVGKNGRGKTYVAKKIYEQLTPYKLPNRDYDFAWFINQSELNLQFNYANAEFNSSVYLYNQAIRTKLFVLDDLGTRCPTAPFLDFLYAVLDFRLEYINSLGTIITTNFDAQTIQKEMGERIYSRIVSGRIYNFNGNDRRIEDNIF